MAETERISGTGSNYIGKHLLVGIKVFSSSDEFLYKEQWHGTITFADGNQIIVKRADNGASVSLPPEVQKAPRGSYRLRSTGEVVVDPDYLATWAQREGDAKRAIDETNPPTS